jgi:hypothetical protein
MAIQVHIGLGLDGVGLQNEVGHGRLRSISTTMIRQCCLTLLLCSRFDSSATIAVITSHLSGAPSSNFRPSTQLSIYMNGCLLTTRFTSKVGNVESIQS